MDDAQVQAKTSLLHFRPFSISICKGEIGSLTRVYGVDRNRIRWVSASGLLRGEYGNRDFVLSKFPGL
jgi:hypothetical protein